MVWVHTPPKNKVFAPEAGCQKCFPLVNHPNINGWNHLDHKDFWNISGSYGSNLRKWYLRDGEFKWQNIYLFGWNHMDFKDFLTWVCFLRLELSSLRV